MYPDWEVDEPSSKLDMIIQEINLNEQKLDASGTATGTILAEAMLQ